jgi:hypothetical protein
MSFSESLLAGTTIDKRGSFTVDVEKAKSKLERFRLSNPLLYTVELVQAAALAGAERVDITVDADDFSLWFSPKIPVTRETLDDLESAILVRSKDTHPARLQLALAVSAAAALSPARMSVKADGVVMTVEDGVTTLTDGPSQNVVRFDLKEAFRAGHFVEFFKGLVGATEEERLLRRACRYAPYAVVVNNKEISRQPWPSTLAVDVVGRDGHREGVGYLPDSTEASRLVLLRAGVVQEELSWAEADAQAPAKGMFAVVDGAHLDRDASFARFVRDDRFVSLLRGLDRHIRDSAALLEPGILEGNADALSHARTMAVWFGGNLMRQSGKVAGARVIADAPLLVDPIGRPLTLRRVAKVAGDNGGVVLTRNKSESIDADTLADDVIVQLRDITDIVVVGALELATADGSERIETRLKKRARYLDFKSRRAPETIAGTLLRRISLTLGAQVVEVGLRSDGSAELNVTVAIEGHTLTTIRRPFPVAGLSILITGGCTPNSTYDDVERDAAFGAAIARAIGALPTLLHGPYSPSEQGSGRFADALLPFLATALDGGVLLRAARDALNLGASTKYLPKTELVGGAAHDAVHFPLVPVFPSGRVSLASLRTGKTPLGVVPPGTPPFQASTPNVVVAGDTLRGVLRLAVPARPIVSLDDEVMQFDRQRRVLARAPSTRHIDGVGFTLTVEESVGGSATHRRVGVVGFLPPGPAAPLGLRLRVLFRGRVLQDNTVSSPLLGLVASIDDSGLTLTEDLRPTDIAPLVEMAFGAVPDLMARMAAGREPNAWHLATSLVDLVFPTPLALSVWQRMATSTGKKATAEWRAILEICDRLDATARDRAFEGLAKSKAVPSSRALSSTTASKAASGISAVLGPVWRDESVITGLLSGLSLGALELTSLDGGRVTLGALVKAGTVKVTNSAGSVPDGFADVVVVDPLQRSLLIKMGVAVVDSDEYLNIARARLAFESRSQEAARLSPTLDAVLRRPISTKHVGGELALMRGPATTSPAATVEVLHNGRRLATVDVGGSVNVSMVAVVEAAEINPTANFSAIVADRRKEEMLTVIRDAAAGAVEELIDTFKSAKNAPDGVDDDVRARLIEYVGKVRKRPSEARIHSAIMALPLFRTVGGNSISLGSRSKSAPLQMLTVHPAGTVPADFADAVVITEASLRFVLDRITQTQIVDEALRQALTKAKQKAQLSPFLPLPADILAMREVTIGDMTLTLVVPAHDARTGLDVGAEGLLVDTVDAPGPLPVRGRLNGPGAVTDDFSRTRISAKLSASIEREIAALWGVALAVFEKRQRGLPDNIDVDDDAFNHIEAHRERLLDALCRLHRRSIQRSAQSLSPEWLSMKNRLMLASLLRLDTGGRISIEEAMTLLPREHRDFLVSAAFVDAQVVAALEAPPSPEPEPARLPSATPTPTAAPTPEPERREPEQKPPPPPAPAPPSPAMILLDRLMSELRTIRSGQEELVSDAELSRISVQARGGKSLVLVRGGDVVVDIDHVLAAEAVVDGAALVVVVAAAISALNSALESVTDEEERKLIVAVARYSSTLDRQAG